MINLQTLKDKDLFQLTHSVNDEIKRRLLELLKKSLYSLYYFSTDTIISVTVYNMYDNFSEETKVINVSAVGYSTEKGTNGPEDFVYVLDEKSHLYTGEELDCLWDVYSELKKNL